MKTAIAFIAALFAFVCINTSANAQSANDISSLVGTQNFYFDMQTVTSMGGRTRTSLAGQYFVRITKDSIVSDLPYFGAAYTATLDPTEIGIKFISKKFTYLISQKKNRWDITIKPKDADDVQSMFFTIFDNGSTSLQINTNSRQPISYMGDVKSN